MGRYPHTVPSDWDIVGIVAPNQHDKIFPQTPVALSRTQKVPRYWSYESLEIKCSRKKEDNNLFFFYAVKNNPMFLCLSSKNLFFVESQSKEKR